MCSGSSLGYRGETLGFEMHDGEYPLLCCLWSALVPEHLALGIPPVSTSTQQAWPSSPYEHQLCGSRDVFKVNELHLGFLLCVCYKNWVLPQLTSALNNTNMEALMKELCPISPAC